MLLNDVTIRTILHEKRMSQVELAEITGLGRSTVSAVCNGKSCSGDSALAIAEALKLPLDSLIKK